MSIGISLSNRWLGEDTRRHYLLGSFGVLGSTIINIQSHPFTRDKAHIALITDVELDGLTLDVDSFDQEDHNYVVALIRKTPTNWWQAAALFIARELASRGRIRLIER